VLILIYDESFHKKSALVDDDQAKELPKREQKNKGSKNFGKCKEVGFFST
jgi:hypothetical protein